jgi:hypothetical protein
LKPGGFKLKPGGFKLWVNCIQFVQPHLANTKNCISRSAHHVSSPCSADATCACSPRSCGPNTDTRSVLRCVERYKLTHSKLQILKPVFHLQVSALKLGGFKLWFN